MHGKATLILTDKDTGRVVKQVEEHNMLTNALNSIFSLPPTLVYPDDSKRVFEGYLPMYRHLLKGLILFGNTIPENPNNFMLGAKYNVVATAGDEYSGSDLMRGNFNTNQSCEIENGYRFVWDFAPEKAIGTIKSLSLTHRLMGNRGNLLLSGAYSYYMINPSDLSNSSYNSSVTVLYEKGTVFLQKGRSTFYIYDTARDHIKIIKYRISDPLGFKICDTLSPVLESETKIDLNLECNLNTSLVFYDPATKRLYAVQYSTAYINDVNYYKFRYARIDPLTCEKEYESPDWITTGAKYAMNTYTSAVYNGKIYICGPNCIISVCSLATGKLENVIDLGLSDLIGFLTLDGKLAIICRFPGSRRCIYVLDGGKTLIHQPENQYKIIDSDENIYPYCYANYLSTTYLMFRTDYLATINNLSMPIEKTDQHALQVRYEITN